MQFYSLIKNRPNLYCNTLVPLAFYSYFRKNADIDNRITGIKVKCKYMHRRINLTTLIVTYKAKSNANPLSSSIIALGYDIVVESGT